MFLTSERVVILGLTLTWVQNDRDRSLRRYRGTTCLLRRFDLNFEDRRRFRLQLSLSESISSCNVVGRPSLAPCGPSSQGLPCELSQQLINARSLEAIVRMRLGCS